MSTKSWNLQVNTRSGYVDKKEQDEDEILRHQVNQTTDDDEDDGMLYPIGVNPNK